MRLAPAGIAVWLGVLGLVAASSQACSVFSPPKPPPPLSDEELAALCDAELPDLPDRHACEKLGYRLLEAGDVAGARRRLGRACGKIRSACTAVGRIYLKGYPDVPQDIDEGLKYMGLACLPPKMDPNGCGWQLIEVLREARQDYPMRASMEMAAHNSCYFDDSVGWPCTNYGVALACGLFGPPDLEHARSALHKGCTLGDSRACDILDKKLRGDSPPQLSCELIVPDPKHPIDIAFSKTPIPPDAVLPEGKTPFDRNKPIWRR